MPAVIGVLAPGFNTDPSRFAMATELTRITFPYLLLISLVTLYGGILNALGRFATPAAAPILLLEPGNVGKPCIRSVVWHYRMTKHNGEVGPAAFRNGALGSR